VHRYLGSKEEIYRAVMRRNENAMREAAGATTDLDQALSLMFREGLGRHRSYLRLIAHSALKGIPYETGIVRFRATERLVELAEKRAGGVSGTRPEAVDPRVVVAAIVALYVGWASMGSWVVQATGLAEVDEDTIDAELERIILHLADAIAPGGDEG
jgi:AcrR family transcriptional regulator